MKRIAVIVLVIGALLFGMGSAQAHHEPGHGGGGGKPPKTTTTTVVTTTTTTAPTTTTTAPTTTTSTTQPQGNVFNVPGSIASNCSVDVTAALNAWIDSVPDGTASTPNTLAFAGGCYRVDGTLGAAYGSNHPAGHQRSHLIFDGNGATIDGSQFLPPILTNRAGFSFTSANGVTVQEFTILGNHPNPCNLDANGNCRDGGYNSQREWQHGIAFFGSNAVTARNNTIRNVYGDCVTLAQDPQTTNALVEGNTCDGTGRMGVALTSNDGAAIRGNSFDRISYHVVDIEPEVMGVRNVEFSGNTVGRHYLGVVASGSGECVARSNITVTDNVQTHAGVTTWPPYLFDAPAQCAPMTDLVFTGNTVLKADGGAGPPAWHNAAVRVQRVQNARINDNRIIQNRADTGAIAFSGASGTLEVSNNDMREVNFVYSINGVEHGAGVTSCGNTTLAGTNKPVPCAGTVTPPASIASNCSSDVSAALTSWIATVPNGSTIDFATNGCYRTDGTVWVTGKTGLTLDGNGSTFKRFVQGSVPNGIQHLFVTNSADIEVHHLTILGTNTVSDIDPSTPRGLTAFEPLEFGSNCGNYCFETGLQVDNTDGVHVHDITVDAVWGDGLLFGGEHATELVTDALVQNVTVDRNGRQGFTIATVDGIRAENVDLLHSWASGYDLEVNAFDGFIRNVEIIGGYVNAWGVAVSACGQGGSHVLIDGVYVKRSLESWPWLTICGNLDVPQTDWVVTNNVSEWARAGAESLYFDGVTDIVATGNTSPGQGNVAVRVLDAPMGVFNVRDNIFTGHASVSNVSGACGNSLGGAFNQPVPC